MKISFQNPTGLSDESYASLQSACHPLGGPADLEPLYKLIGDARLVLLGEATHGTHEYYTWRSAISQKLIEEKGFNFIAVEGDWPDCYRINRYVKNYSDSGKKADELLKCFQRWPTWMWANWEIAALMEWMRSYNLKREKGRQVGFYGLDVYSLWESIEALYRYLKKNDPPALSEVQRVLDCFGNYGMDEGTSYARAHLYFSATCEDEVVQLLANIRQKLPQYNTDPEMVFSTEQNALVTVNAERYYRAMVHGGAASWNIRDMHMMETLNRLLDFHGPGAKAIVWEHNTHIGDARATDMALGGYENIGQYAMEQHASSGVIKVGFGSYAGTVMAGSAWASPMQEMEVPPAQPGSWEEMLHNVGEGDLYINTSDLRTSPFFRKPVPHRAIGVVYDPKKEKYGNYVPSVIPDRYDAFIFIDESRALHPLHIHPDKGQVPETFPWGE